MEALLKPERFSAVISLSLLAVLCSCNRTATSQPVLVFGNTHPQTYLVPTIASNTTYTVTYVQWAPVAGATSYELWLDTNSDFGNPQMFTGLVASIFTPSDLVIGETYYWRVRTISLIGPSDWSVTWSFVPKILPQP